MYDILAGGENMESSYVMSKGKALEAFPMLKAEGLVGAVVYYDGTKKKQQISLNVGIQKQISFFKGNIMTRE